MLVVSDNATKRLAQMLDEIRAPEGIVSRLFIEDEDTLSMQPGKQEPGDTTYDHDGRVVLVIDEDSLAAMEGMILDVDDQAGDELNLEVRPQPVDLITSFD